MTERIRLLDVNTLIALTNPSHLRHEAAHHWLFGPSLPIRWATTPLTEAAFIRLMTNPAVTGRRLAAVDALRVLAELRGMSAHVFVPDESSLADPHIGLTALVGTTQVTDFHLVNLAASTGAVLATFDTRIALSLGVADRQHVETIPSGGL